MRLGQQRLVRAHPRACGENMKKLKADEKRFGSSPRVRGKQKNHESHAGRGRLIPARAGKTLAWFF